MQIAELFVSLGIKNADKTISALTQVQTNLGKVASTSLEVKAAILGAMYALEHLMSESTSRATSISNFSTLVGLSTKELQQWQYAANQGGESNEQFAASFKAVQDKLALLKLSQSEPEGLKFLVSVIPDFDIKRATEDGKYMWLEMQKYLQLSKSPIDIQNKMASSFGYGNDAIIAMRRNAFNETNFKKAPLYNDNEINNLYKIGIAWDNLNRKIQMFIGHLNAKYGMQLITDINLLLKDVLKLIDAFALLAKKLELFKWVQTMFKGWENILNTINDVLDKINAKTDKQKSDAEKRLEKEPLYKFLQNPFNPFYSGDDRTKNKQLNHDDTVLDNFNNQMNKEDYLKDFKNDFQQLFSSFIDIIIGKSLYNQNVNQDDKSKIKFIPNNIPNQVPNIKNNIIPKVAPNTNNKNNTHNTTINQSLNFQHEGKNAIETKDSVHQAVAYSWKQLSSQTQAT